MVAQKSQSRCGLGHEWWPRGGGAKRRWEASPDGAVAGRAGSLMVTARRWVKAPVGDPAQNGAGVVLTAACWWRMARRGSGSRLLAAKIRSPGNPRPDGDGLLPLPKGLVTIGCNRAAFRSRTMVALLVAAD